MVGSREAMGSARGRVEVAVLPVFEEGAGGDVADVLVLHPASTHEDARPDA